MNTPLAFALLACSLLSGCAPYLRMGRFINLETGEEVRVEAVGSRDGAVLLAGAAADGRAVRGELWELKAFEAPKDGSGPVPAPPGDTLYHGTGFLRDGDRVLEFSYLRHKESWTGVGTATDNRGGRYKAVFWRARKPEAAIPAHR